MVRGRYGDDTVKPFQSIAVGYDGSPDSTIAVRWALRAAQEADASVTIVHATGLLEHLRTRYSPDELPPELPSLAQSTTSTRVVSDGSSPTATRVRCSCAWPRHPSTPTRWSSVRAATESVKDYSWAVRVSKSPNTPRSRSSSFRRPTKTGPPDESENDVRPYCVRWVTREDSFVTCRLRH